MQYSTLDAELIDSMSQSLIRYNCLLSTDTCTNRGGGRLRGARRPGGGRRGGAAPCRLHLAFLIMRAARKDQQSAERRTPSGWGRNGQRRRVGSTPGHAQDGRDSGLSRRGDRRWVGLGFFFSCAGGVGFFFCFFSSHAQVGLTKMDRLSCCTCLLCSFAHRILPRWNLLLATSEH
jgi:hypothetical protein